MMIANQSSLDAARIGFHAAFLAQLGVQPTMPLEALLAQVNSTTSLEEWEWLGDFPGFEEWIGDRKLAGMSAFKMRIANKDWSSGLRLHQNQFKDDKLGLFPMSTAGLAQVAKQHRADMAVQLLINGFAGTAYPTISNGLAYDGKFFFDTTRVTGSNKLTTALDDTGAGLDAAELLLGSQTTYDQKRKLRIFPSHLVVGPKLAPIARRLMTSDFIASVSGNATISNPYKNRYVVIVDPWLTGTYDDYWFLADLTQAIKPCIFQLREEISTSAILGQQGGSNDSEPRFKRGELWFGAEARYNVGYFEPRLIVGSLVA